MLKFLRNLKKDKNEQELLLNKLASKQWIVKLFFGTINLGSRLIVPLYYLYSLFLTKNRSNIIFLHRIVRDELQLKRDDYMNLMEERSDSYGFIEHEKCDSLLFTGLVGSVGWKTIITKARDSEGAWHRRDVDCPCYPNGSKSTISRDMLLGLMWYIWRNSRLDLAEELWNYGTKHKWIMGKGDISRIYLTPALQATLAEIIYQLGGKRYAVARSLPQTWNKGLEGYQAHLQMLHIALRGELLGYIDGSMMSAIDDMLKRYNNNQLLLLIKARYADGQHIANTIGNIAAIGLEDIKLWPRDRLPTNADRRAHWYFETNDSTPGDDKTDIHTGGDLIFCASLVLDYSDNID